MAEEGTHLFLGELGLSKLKDVEQVLRPIWMALFDPAFGKPKHLLHWIQKGQIGVQEKELELEMTKTLSEGRPATFIWGRYPRFLHDCGGPHYQVR